jgi:hypothetical protein
MNNWEEESDRIGEILGNEPSKFPLRPLDTKAPSDVTSEQGILGQLVPNEVTITSGNQGSFQMQNDALMSYAAGGPFTVYTGNVTVFENIDGLVGLESAGAANLVTRSLVFDNNGVPVVFAGRVRVLP